MRRFSAGLLAIAGCVALVLAHGSEARSADRPNFIILMTDDQRWDALGCAGHPFLQTPNLDRLAAEGMRFRQMFVTNALCAPSRASLLTGKYSHTHGVIDNNRRRLPADQPLLSDRLRAAGYEVAFCGKSHVEGSLRDRTWDYYFGYQGQGDYLKPQIAEGVAGRDVPYTGYIDDLVTNRACTWLTQRGEQPFCLFLWFKAPHRPWQRPRRLHDLFRDVTVPKPDTYDDDFRGFPGKPRAFVEADNRIGDFLDVRTLDELVKNYLATVVSVDDNVGRLLTTLEQTGKSPNTAVFFTSDNGFFLGEWGRFDKRFMHEVSIRVPLLVRWPQRVLAGSLCDEMALNIDLAPTVLEWAGVERPTDLHGRSLVPLLEGKPVAWREDWLYEYFEYPGVHSVRKQRGVRTRTHKLIHYYESPEEFELYDLARDPQERENLYGRPEVASLVTDLQSRLARLRVETGDVP